jgi:hypothetical protein
MDVYHDNRERGITEVGIMRGWTVMEGLEVAEYFKEG